jgi:Ni/Co efflux regulator RcnB
MSTHLRSILLSAAVLGMAVGGPVAGLAQQVMTTPRGGTAAAGPNGAAVRGPNGGAAARAPNGAAVRGPNGGAVAVGHNGAAVRPAYGARTTRAYTYGGRRYYGVYARPFVYPAGYAYRRWVVGAVLPAMFLASTYYYTGYATMGLPPPAPGHMWVRYGPDLLLVNLSTGAVIHSAYGVFE